MAFYCGIDLHSKISQVGVIDDALQIHANKKVPNDLGAVIEVLSSVPERPRVVVESTFNWYWLVDGLQDAGFDVTLAHTLALSMITKAKVKTDRRDAIVLARLLRMGEIPEGYIYPRETRGIRDLIRRRTSIVAMRGREYAGLRRLLYQEGLHNHTRNRVRQMTNEEFDALLSCPEVRLVASQELERIDLFSAQIEEIESRILEATRGQPDYQRLHEVPGLGHALAAVVFYESGGMARFKSVRKYSSYSRVVPGAANSGGKTARGRGSKQGNPHLKSAFSQAAVHAVRCYPRIRRYFDRQLNKRRGSARRLVCYNIIAHKLAVASYMILKTGARYEERLLFGV